MDVMGAKKTTRDWSQLPNDILCEVSLKSDTIQDLVCFSMVCRAWSVAFCTIKSKWRSKFPLLLLAENNATKNNKNEHLRKIFSLDTKTCWELKLPQASGAKCWGSSFGWIVMFHLDRQISLFNPFSKAQIFLPSQLTMPIQYPEDHIEFSHVPYPEMVRNIYFHKILVWKMDEDNDNDNDNDNDGILVVAIRLGMNYEAFALARPGDKAWTYVTTAKDKFAFDILCRGDNIYILYSDGDLGYYSMSRGGNEALDYWATSHCVHGSPFKTHYDVYLVDLLGDLLMVARYRMQYTHNQGTHDETSFFEVLKFDFQAKEWELLHDLGGFTLFVGNNRSMCVPASRLHNINNNCIYFTDDYNPLWNTLSYHAASPDLGVFNMETKEVSAFYQGDGINSTFCPPLWFMPSF